MIVMFKNILVTIVATFSSWFPSPPPIEIPGFSAPTPIVVEKPSNTPLPPVLAITTTPTPKPSLKPVLPTYTPVSPPIPDKVYWDKPPYWNQP